TGKPSVVHTLMPVAPGRPVKVLLLISSMCTMARPVASCPVITRRSCCSAMGVSLARSDGRLDVLVYPPEVGRIVLILERHQSSVVGRVVRRPDPLVALAAHLVDVDAARERLQRRAEPAAPRQVPVRLARIGPDAEDVDVERR